jgi:uncharacterized protein (UPF0261 family)
MIAVSIDAATEEGALAAVDYLRKCGWRSQLFHLLNGGGQALESFVQKENVAGVLDYSLGDLADTRLGGRDASGPDRLTAAPKLGLPMLIVPGGLDHATFVGVAPPLLDLRYQHHADNSTVLVRTDEKDNDELGKEIAYKASSSRGPVAIIFPQGGLSVWDGWQKPLFSPAANQALLESLYHWKAPHVKVIESHRHINDSHFAYIAADHLLKMLVER